MMRSKKMIYLLVGLALALLAIFAVNWNGPLDSSLFVNEAPPKEALVGNWTITWNGLNAVSAHEVNLSLRADGSFSATNLTLEQIAGHDVKREPFTGNGTWSLEKDMSWQVSLLLSDHSGHELTVKKIDRNLILEWHYFDENDEEKLTLEKM
jgi:hypothetical protein